jgi:putative membrane protein
MDLSRTGVWAMILCWLSAIGGIAMAILWAASKNRSPVDDESVRQSLERRLKAGEISQAEYEKRSAQLGQQKAGRGKPAPGKPTPPGS